MEFKDHVDKIIKMELTSALKQKSIIMEHDFKDIIHNRHGLSMSTISGAIRRTSPKMGLIRRHLTDELKHFYKLDVPGYPVVYLKIEN